MSHSLTVVHTRSLCMQVLFRAILERGRFFPAVEGKYKKECFLALLNLHTVLDITSNVYIQSIMFGETEKLNIAHNEWSCPLSNDSTILRKPDGGLVKALAMLIIAFFDADIMYPFTFAKLLQLEVIIDKAYF